MDLSKHSKGPEEAGPSEARPNSNRPHRIIINMAARRPPRVHAPYQVAGLGEDFDGRSSPTHRRPAPTIYGSARNPTLGPGPVPRHGSFKKRPSIGVGVTERRSPSPIPKRRRCYSEPAMNLGHIRDLGSEIDGALAHGAMANEANETVLNGAQAKGALGPELVDDLSQSFERVDVNGGNKKPMEGKGAAVSSFFSF